MVEGGGHVHNPHDQTHASWPPTSLSTSSCQRVVRQSRTGDRQARVQGRATRRSGEGGKANDGVKVSTQLHRDGAELEGGVGALGHVLRSVARVHRDGNVGSEGPHPHAEGGHGHLRVGGVTVAWQLGSGGGEGGEVRVGGDAQECGGGGNSDSCLGQWIANHNHT